MYFNVTVLGALTGPINYYRAAFQYKMGVDFPQKKLEVSVFLDIDQQRVFHVN